MLFEKEFQGGFNFFLLNFTLNNIPSLSKEITKQPIKGYTAIRKQFKYPT